MKKNLFVIFLILFNVGCAKVDKAILDVAFNKNEIVRCRWAAPVKKVVCRDENSKDVYVMTKNEALALFLDDTLELIDSDGLRNVLSEVEFLCSKIRCTEQERTAIEKINKHLYEIKK